MDGETFLIKARRCKRCGGLLTGKDAIRNGYGAYCLRKHKEEQADREMAKLQYSLFREEQDEE